MVRDALKARGDPGKRCTFCLFVSNFRGTMSIPTELPYFLVYPTSYVRDLEPDHFDTRNNLVGTRLHCCICHATLQYVNAAVSVGCKWKDVHSEDSHTLNSTLPISSSVFDSLRSPTGSHSNRTELLPPSITSTPLGLAGPRQW